MSLATTSRHLSQDRERPLPIDTNGFIWPTELKFMLLAPACFPSLMKSSDGNLSTRPLHTHCNLLALRENMEQFQPSLLAIARYNTGCMQHSD